MTDKKIIGKRLKFARKKVSKSLKKFCQDYNFSYLKICKWEGGVAMPPINRLTEYLDALKQEGVIVNLPWLINGQGKEPIIIIKNEFENINLKNLNDSKEKFINQLSNNPHICFMQITDEEMEPVYSQGDFVGGAYNIIEESFNKNCIIKFAKNEKIVRRVIKAGNKIAIIPFNQYGEVKYINAENIDHIAPINLHLKNCL